MHIQRDDVCHQNMDSAVGQVCTNRVEAMPTTTLTSTISADLYRHAGASGAVPLARFLLRSPGFRYTFWLRLTAWLRVQQSPVRVLSPFAGLVKRHLTYKFGISIPSETRIGPGFYIGHFGDIVVNGRCVIGQNVNISQGVTLGQANRGVRRGAPIIGDGVYIGPGAKVVGAVRVGSDVAIGANAVVTHDIPDHAVVGGVPAAVISMDGAADYVMNIDYVLD